MDTETYNKLRDLHTELQSRCEDLEDKITGCRLESSLNLLRADYREAVQQKQAIYEQIISLKP